MQVDQQQAESKGLTSQYQGQTFAFCCPACKRQFDQDPQRFAGQQTAK
jgi:YHS domain-containing protein